MYKVHPLDSYAIMDIAHINLVHQSVSAPPTQISSIAVVLMTVC